nr:hypothetical protein [Tanacetum cinerariifolium]
STVSEVTKSELPMSQLRSLVIQYEYLMSEFESHVSEPVLDMLGAQHVLPSAIDVLIAVVTAALPSSPPPSHLIHYHLRFPRFSHHHYIELASLLLLPDLRSRRVQQLLLLDSLDWMFLLWMLPLDVGVETSRAARENLEIESRACFTTPASRFEVEESSAAAAIRQPRLDVSTVDATPRRRGRNKPSSS